MMIIIIIIIIIIISSISIGVNIIVFAMSIPLIIISNDTGGRASWSVRRTRSGRAA